MKRGGEGPAYIRKTVDKRAIMEALGALEMMAEDWTQVGRSTARGIRIAIDTIDRDLGISEGHPSRGWW